MKLGINGFGRIGKLAAWHHLGEKFFDELVINLGRKAGSSLEDIAHYIERDSTYGLLRGFLGGYRSEEVISDINEKEGSIIVDGIKVKFLQNERDPAAIGWHREKVRLVVDATGKYLDPTLPPDCEKGSARGHLESGAEKVIVSAPFKIGQKGAPMPEDAVTTVMGINENSYDPRIHRIISNASCTTTCLAHMIKPLLNRFGYKRILSASMATVHAATGSQQVLDRLPASGKTPPKKSERAEQHNTDHHRGGQDPKPGHPGDGENRLYRGIGQGARVGGLSHHTGHSRPKRTVRQNNNKGDYKRYLQEDRKGRFKKISSFLRKTERVRRYNRPSQGGGRYRGA